MAAALGRFSTLVITKPVTMTKAKYGDDGYNTILSNVKGGTPDIEDWPITYDEHGPYYNAWEKAIGVVGTNQDPFIPNAKFPMPPHPATPYAEIFKTAVQSLGYHSISDPSAFISGGYTNQYGVSRNACVYCGWCGGAMQLPLRSGSKNQQPCLNNSMHQLHSRKGNFDMRLNSYVFRIDTDSTRKSNRRRIL